MALKLNDFLDIQQSDPDVFAMNEKNRLLNVKIPQSDRQYSLRFRENRDFLVCVYILRRCGFRMSLFPNNKRRESRHKVNKIKVKHHEAPARQTRSSVRLQLNLLNIRQPKNMLLPRESADSRSKTTGNTKKLEVAVLKSEIEAPEPPSETPGETLNSHIKASSRDPTIAFGQASTQPTHSYSLRSSQRAESSLYDGIGETYLPVSSARRAHHRGRRSLSLTRDPSTSLSSSPESRLIASLQTGLRSGRKPVYLQRQVTAPAHFNRIDFRRLMPPRRALPFMLARANGSEDRPAVVTETAILGKGRPSHDKRTLYHVMSPTSSGKEHASRSHGDTVISRDTFLTAMQANDSALVKLNDIASSILEKYISDVSCGKDGTERAELHLQQLYKARVQAWCDILQEHTPKV